MNMDDYLGALDGVLARHEEPTFSRKSVGRPSAKSIYQQRKEYAQTVSKGNSDFHYRVQHLLTYNLNNELRNIQDCLKHLRLLDAEGKVWGQDMILQIQNDELVLTDLESRDNLESIPLQNVESCHPEMGPPPYNSLLAVIIQNQTNSSIMLFQCDEQPATIVHSNLEKALAQFKGKQRNKDNIRNQIQKNFIPSYVNARAQSPQPSPALESPILSRKGRETPQDSPILQRRFEPAPENFQAPSRTQSPDQGLEIARDIEILNHVLADIEMFIGYLDSNKKMKKGKSSISESDFYSCFQKIKYAFNLLGKLQAHLSRPSAVDFVHMLMNILPKILSKCPQKNMSSSVLSPFPTQKMLLLLSSCVTDKERKLWESLGDAWLRTRMDWPNGNAVPPYIPTFSDGWIIPEVPTSNTQEYSEKLDISTAIEYAEHVQQDRTPHTQRRINSEYMKILFDFEARNERELSVKKGENVKVLDQSRQWWLVENEQMRRGFVPSNILESSNIEQVPVQPVLLQPSSSPEEVTTWLKEKGFSRITVKSLGVLTGDQLLELSFTDLKAVCPEEGGRVFTQLNEVRSFLGI